MLEAVQLEKDVFISNWKGKDGHPKDVESLAFSNNSKYLVTVCYRMAKAWKISGSMAGGYCSIEDTAVNIDLVKPLACISNDGTLVIVYRQNLVFKCYEIASGQPRHKDTIDLQREIRATIRTDF